MQICGEHKRSGILRNGFYASPFFEDADASSIASEPAARDAGVCLLFYMLGTCQQLLLAEHSQVVADSRCLVILEIANLS